jgi:hypothetical protein
MQLTWETQVLGLTAHNTAYCLALNTYISFQSYDGLLLGLSDSIGLLFLKESISEKKVMEAQTFDANV